MSSGTRAQWEKLADEAIADAGYWKAEARKAQSQRDFLLNACRFAVYQIQDIRDTQRCAITLPQVQQKLVEAIQSTAQGGAK